MDNFTWINDKKLEKYLTAQISLSEFINRESIVSVNGRLGIGIVFDSTPPKRGSLDTVQCSDECKQGETCPILLETIGAVIEHQLENLSKDDLRTKYEHISEWSHGQRQKCPQWDKCHLLSVGLVFCTFH